jgi:hypothetical protein
MGQQRAWRKSPGAPRGPIIGERAVAAMVQPLATKPPHAFVNAGPRVLAGAAPFAARPEAFDGSLRALKRDGPRSTVDARALNGTAPHDPTTPLRCSAGGSPGDRAWPLHAVLEARWRVPRACGRRQGQARGARRPSRPLTAPRPKRTGWSWRGGGSPRGHLRLARLDGPVAAISCLPEPVGGRRSRSPVPASAYERRPGRIPVSWNERSARSAVASDEK